MAGAPARPLASSSALSRWALGLAVGASTCAVGCTTDDSTDDGTTTFTTAVVVDPAEFLGGVRCGVPGGADTYVATLIDVATGEELARSRAVSCGAKTAFSDITTGSSYGARITVSDDLGAFLGETSCGLDGEGAALAASQTQVTIRGCLPLYRGGRSPAIRVDATALASSLGCAGTETGLVQNLVVTPIEPVDSGLPELSVQCGDPAITFGAGIVPGEVYSFRVTANDFPIEQFWGATCTARAEAGAVVTTSCSALTKVTTLRFPLPTLLAEAGLECSTPAPGVADYAPNEATQVRIRLLSGPPYTPPVDTSSTTVSCEGEAVLGGVVAGPYTATVELEQFTYELAKFTCSVDAEPGALATFECVPVD